MTFIFIAIIVFLLLLLISSRKNKKVYYVSSEPKPEYVVYDKTERKQSRFERRGIKFLILCAIIALFKMGKNTAED